MRILAFTPTWNDAMRPEMAASMNAQQFDGALEWVVYKDNPYPIPDHRNVLAAYRKARAMCLDGGYDALLTVEHDMILPDDAVQLLCETPGDVAFGVYIHRHSSYDLNAYEYVDAHTLGPSLTHNPAKALAAKAQGVVRVSGSGWGCTLIHRRVLQRFTFPETDPANPPHDLTFARQCVQADLLLMANFGVQCGHITRNGTLWPFRADAEVYRRVCALQTTRIWENGTWLHVETGQEYKLLAATAINLSRYHYVEILP